MQYIFDATGKHLRSYSHSAYPDGIPGVFDQENGEQSVIENNQDKVLEYARAGSIELVQGEIVAYSRITVSVDKVQILADGLDTATITATTPDDTEISFIVDGVEYIRPATNGIASLQVTYDTAGKLMLHVISPTKYGRNYLPLEVVPVV